VRGKTSVATSSSRRAVVLKISRRKLRMSDGKMNVRPRRRDAS